MLNSEASRPQHVTLFVNRILADVISEGEITLQLGGLLV